MLAGEQEREGSSNAGREHDAQCQHFSPLCECAVGLDWIPQRMSGHRFSLFDTFANLFRDFCRTVHPIGERTAHWLPLTAFDLTAGLSELESMSYLWYYLPLNKVVVTHPLLRTVNSFPSHQLGAFLSIFAPVGAVRTAPVPPHFGPSPLVITIYPVAASKQMLTKHSRFIRIETIKIIRDWHPRASVKV